MFFSRILRMGLARKGVSVLEYSILLGVIVVGVGMAANIISDDVTGQITKAGDEVAALKLKE